MILRLLKCILSWLRTEEVRIYNHVRDVYDGLDHPYKQTGAALPVRVDWRAACPPVYDQGQLGSCQSNAAIGAEHFLEMKDGLPSTMLSRLMCYYDARALEGTVKQDAGA